MMNRTRKNPSDRKRMDEAASINKNRIREWKKSVGDFDFFAEYRKAARIKRQQAFGLSFTTS